MPVYDMSLTTTGSAGSATATAYTPREVHGAIEYVKVTYDASAPATTDVTVSLEGLSGETVLALTNANTTVTKRPRVALHDTSGVDSGVSGYILIPTPGTRVKVDVAGCDPLSNAVRVQIGVILQGSM